MAESKSAGLVDLEKELTCSICTEVLYQPLTLLDCLHTFCGSCLKEWFSWQASQASTSRPNPFSCPSCRALVRETRPNAGITTLLEMYLQANPQKGRSKDEREGLQERYKPGDIVLPKIKRRKERDDEAEDRRMVEEVREMSLQEVGVGGTGSYERGTRHRVRDRARSARNELEGQRGDHAHGDHSAGEETVRPSTASEAASQARQIGHQSSLRSLISSSDLDSSEMEETILRQIMDEGILDGIDLNNIDVSQEDELSEKIADAYRRRHGQRSRVRTREGHDDAPVSPDIRNQRSIQERQHGRAGRSPNPTAHSPQSSHPPVSRPHLLEVYPTDQGHRRRSSSETRRQTSRIPRASTGRPSSETQRQAARSATDLTSNARRPSNTAVRPANPPSNNRRTTDPENARPRRESRDHISQHPRSSDPRSSESPSTAASQSPSLNHVVTEALPSPRLSGPTVSEPGIAPSDDQPVPHQHIRPSPIDPTATCSVPSISCDRCQKQSIEFDVHWNCVRCNEGMFNLCLRCYRSGRGCLHWYGFGYAAMQRFRKQEPPEGYAASVSFPHHLEGHCFLRPDSGGVQPAPSGLDPSSTIDPQVRLQSGPFCSNCLRFTPSCFWKCELCNEGEWGFCNRCVNQGKCCTHALQSVALKSTGNSRENVTGFTLSHSSAMPIKFSPTSSVHPLLRNTADEERYIPLHDNTKCDICTYPIPPSITRLHCPQCKEGDYDIDFACYHKLVHNGKISTENGSKGWRRCLRGHRMIVVGFEDSDLGQRRIVVEDLVGGYALNDDRSVDGEFQWNEGEGRQRQVKTVSNASIDRTTVLAENPPKDNINSLLKQYPPNGGVGMHAVALWSWWPKVGAANELAFPKGAEIRECQDINGDWSRGVYCAREGFFPSNHARVIIPSGLLR